MGHCSVEMMQGSSDSFKMTDKGQTAENNIETKPKEKMKNNTYEKIKHIVSKENIRVPAQKAKPQKKIIDIGF